MKTAASAAVLLSGVLIAGCDTLSSMSSSSPTPTPTPSTRTPAPAPRYNLTGYSAAFRQGYADACTTPRRRNAERFKSDIDYSMGWQDGQSACRAR